MKMKNKVILFFMNIFLLLKNVNKIKIIYKKWTLKKFFLKNNKNKES